MCVRVCVCACVCAVVAAAAAEAVAGGDTRKTDTSKRKDVKKDGGTQEKRGERLVKNSKYIYLNGVFCGAEASSSSSSSFFYLLLLLLLLFAHKHAHTHADTHGQTLVPLRLIAARAV